MEKYSKWSDAGTGIHPFIPNKDTRSTLQKWLGALFLAPIRLLLFMIFFLLLRVSTSFFNLIGRNKVTRVFERMNEVVLGRSLLFTLGFFSIRYNVVSPTRKSIPNTTGERVSGGDIILSNHTSYVEILYLLCKYGPMFTAIPNTLSDNQEVSPPIGVKVLSWHEAYWHSISCFSVRSNEAIPLSEALERARKCNMPLVIFPEGATSNGRALLKPFPVLQGFPLSSLNRVHILALRAESKQFSPCYTVGGYYSHLFALSSQFFNQLQVKVLYSLEIPPMTPSAWQQGKKEEMSEQLKVREGWIDEVFNQLSKILNVKKTELTAKDKIQFIQYWDYSHQTNYTKSS